jgi:LmbE family N-acetylglucosaminyl deacetylase
MTFTKLSIPAFLFLSVISLNAQPVMSALTGTVNLTGSSRIENYTGKSILVFTPHPDDETFSMGGTLALLQQNKNTIRIVIYTNDNKGSLDLSMTREKLAVIRRAEEEEACRILGIPKENIIWLGYEDGDLEYADPRILRGEVARLIKKFRPDVVFAPDPGTKSVQWHKTDHRMAAQISTDALIAAEWHLYYPQHLLDEKLQPFSVKEVFYYYSQEPNYETDITNVFDLKMKAAGAHVSQFEPSVSQYTPVLNPKTAEGIKTRFAEMHLCGEGKCRERFRKAE